MKIIVSCSSKLIIVLLFCKIYWDMWCIYDFFPSVGKLPSTLL